jgi:transcription initiation factor TFIIB
MTHSWCEKFMQRTDTAKGCPECGCRELIKDYDTGEQICRKCGMVVNSTSIDHGPEWRAFNVQQKEDRPRVGSPLTLTIHDKGLSTKIGWKNRDASGRKMKAQDKYKFYRLRKWNRRSKISDSSQRNLATALNDMSRTGYDLRLPRNILETASQIYRRALQKGYTRGRTIKSVTATTIYMACRQCNVIRSLEDVAKSANISKKEVARTYRFLLRHMETEVPLFSPQKYISKYVNKLNLSGVTERIANKLLKEAAEQRLTCGRGPGGITAACVYIASQITGENRTQGDIATVAQVTEVTIRNRYKEILEKMDIIIPT